LFFLWFEGGFFMADEKEKRPIFDPAQPRETLFPLVQGKDQQKPFFDLRGPIKGLFARRDIFPLVQGEDQQETFVDLGQPILPAIGLIEKAANLVASAAAFVAYASERQLLDRKVLSDAMRTLRNIPKSDTMLWADKGKEAEKKYNARQAAAGTDLKFIKASLGQPNFLPMEGLVDKAMEFLKTHFKNFNYTATEGDPTVIKAVEAFMQTRFFFNDQDCMREKKYVLPMVPKKAYLVCTKRLWVDLEEQSIYLILGGCLIMRKLKTPAESQREFRLHNLMEAIDPRRKYLMI